MLRPKPWMIVPISTALETCEELKKLSEHFDFVLVKDEDLQKTVRLVAKARVGKKLIVPV